MIRFGFWGLLAIFLLNSCAALQREKEPSMTPPQSKINTDSSLEAQLNHYRAAETRYFDLLHTRLDVSFDFQKQHLLGKAWLRFKPYFYPQTQLVLDAKGFDLKEVALQLGTDSLLPLEFVYDNKLLTIFLENTYTRSDTLTIYIDYVAKPNELEQGGSEAITQDKGLYFIDPLDTDPFKPTQIWTQGETEASSCWFPTLDAPNERCTQEMYITVPRRFLTLSNGTLVYSKHNQDSTRTDYWKMELPHAPYLFMMTIGEFAVAQDKWRELEVSYYVEPEYGTYARDIFGNTPEMLEFFSRLLSYEYPWSKYAQVAVRDYVSGAMENTSASLFMEDVQITAREKLDNDWDDIIAHELFHQWFGDLVTCESWSNLPLNESFATYAEYLWSEYKKGREEADFHLLEELDSYLDESKQKKVDLIRFHYDDKEDMFDSHSYAKGSCILHMLRAYVGDEAFFQSLGLYLQRHAFSSVEIHDLRLAFEAVTGEDLNWFFNQWFLSSGHPVLEVSQSFTNGELSLTLEQKQDHQNAPLYRLPLSIEVWIGEEKKRFNEVLNKHRQTFAYSLDSEPSLVLVDAEQVLLAEISQTLTPEQVAFQFYHSDKVRARIRALQIVLEDSNASSTYERLRLSAMNDSFWAIRQRAINSWDSYQGPLKEEVVNALKNVAHSDQESTVRADAITILSSIDSTAFREFFKAFTQDSSYSVMGAALVAYAHSLPVDERLPFLQQYEIYQNINLILPLADYYATNKIKGKGDWFMSKLNQIKGVDLYYFIGYFGNYLFAQEKSAIGTYQKDLSVMAMDHPKYYVRLAAYRALSLFDDQADIAQLLTDIKAAERHPRLIKIYASM
ncbi:MAG: M1 family metallopeptidase [Cytophagales bacterium]|nr:M1 family metallopeptidase [Cytophagales bacterium]